MILLKEMEAAIREIEEKVNQIHRVILGVSPTQEVNKAQVEDPVIDSRKYGWEMEMPFDEVVRKMGGSNTTGK